MSTDNQEELKRVTDKILHIKMMAYDQLQMIVRGNVKPQHIGYASIEGATTGILTKASKETEALTKAYEKAYPA